MSEANRSTWERVKDGIKTVGGIAERYVLREAVWWRRANGSGENPYEVVPEPGFSPRRTDESTPSTTTRRTVLLRSGRNRLKGNRG